MIIRCGSMLCTHSLSLPWRQNGHDCVSNHQLHDCLLNRLFRRRSQETSKLRLTGLCDPGEFTGDRWIPRTKGQLRGKCFHLMTSSCFMCWILNISDSLMSIPWLLLPGLLDVEFSPTLGLDRICFCIELWDVIALHHKSPDSIKICRLSIIFPFNHMESEDDFINECHCRLETWCKTSQLIYNPYDSNRSDFHACSDFDPDLNFYNEQNLYTGYLCKYVIEGQFNENLLSLNCPNSNVPSLIHANLRSIRANLVEFENYLKLLHIEFRIIGVTETWLNESSRGLYGMNNSLKITEQTKLEVASGCLWEIIFPSWNDLT